MDPLHMIHSRRADLDERIGKLRAELAALEQERGELDIAERVFLKLIPPAESEEPQPGQFGGDEMRAAGLLTPQGNVRGELDDHMRSVILEKGRPVPRAELIELLRARGVPINQSQPGAFIGMRLKRRPQMFKNFEPQGWWLTDVDYPPLDYFPEQKENGSSTASS